MNALPNSSGHALPRFTVPEGACDAHVHVVDRRFAVAAPAGTPEPILERINIEIGKVISDPAVTARFAELALQPAAGSRSAFDVHRGADRQVEPRGEGQRHSQRMIE
ncbi:MAG: hypothetical protein F9K44_06505 [Hyphomicrobiaceae bacterium]|nr:MAG: hypothetical protein F9K44_06505 [Hyphomicrobiaceae bacterium]